MSLENKENGILQETIVLLEQYISRQIGFKKFNEKFDVLYYSHSYNQKKDLIEFMEKLSLTTESRTIANAPEESCVIHESKFYVYAKNFLEKLKKQLDEY